MRKHKHKQKDWSSDGFIWIGEDHEEMLIVCGPGKHWVPPGGKKEPEDVDPIATLVREVFQETGIRLKRSQAKLLGSVVRQGRKTKKHYRLFLYEITVTDAQIGKAFPVSSEHELVKIVTRTELAGLVSTGKFSADSARLAEKYGLLKT